MHEVSDFWIISDSYIMWQMGKTATNETATRGNIKIIADESFKPLIETEVFTFTHLYTSAKIKAEYQTRI